MDDSDSNSNNTHTNILQTTEQQQEGNTLHQRHGIKTSRFPLLRDVCHLLCTEQTLECCCTVKSW